MYRESSSFSEKPSETAMAFSRAQARIASISGEATRSEFLMYLTLMSKSTGRLLCSVRVS